MTETVLEQTETERFSSKFETLLKFKNEKLSTLKSPSEFFDKNKFNVSTSFQVVSQRWNYNLQYFSANYILILICLAIYSVLTNWFLLFTIAFGYVGFHFLSRLNQPLNIGGVTFSVSSLYLGYAVTMLILFLASGATGTLLWAVGAAALLILGHAALLEPGLEGDFADNQA